MKHGWYRRICWWSLGILAVVALSGCADRVESDGTITYSMPAWTWISALLLGLLFAGLGVRATSQGWRWWIVSAVCWFLFLPGLYGDRAMLTQESFDLKRGFPFQANSARVEFAQVQRLVVTTSRDRKGRTKMRLVFEHAGDRKTIIPGGDLVKGALPDLLRIMQERGIPILR